jgi:hypothetical protein
VDSRLDFLQKLYDDLLEQFKEKPNIAVFQKAMARQLNELHAFFYQLRVLRWLHSAEGQQLDGIGSIVDLSRIDALVWANAAGQYVPMDDPLYRMYLMFKIFLNTSEGTYKDIVRALKMFWPYSPITYSEYIDRPATMYFTTETMPMNADLRVLQIVTRVKAAGVALHFVIPTAPEEDVGTYFATGASHYIRQYIICDQPEIPTDADDYHATAGAANLRQYIIVDGTPIPNDVEDYGAVGTYHFIREVYTE